MLPIAMRMNGLRRNDDAKCFKSRYKKNGKKYSAYSVHHISEVLKSILIYALFLLSLFLYW